MRVMMALTVLMTVGCAETDTNRSVTEAPEQAASEYRAIVSQQEFNDLVVGRELTWTETNKFVIRADGTLDGDVNGPMAGVWRWADGYWCRTLTTPERPEDCQLWETNGENLRATRNKGSGNRFLYTF